MPEKMKLKESDEAQDSEESSSSERKTPPRVRARHRGQVNSALEAIVEELREKNPDKAYRFVYAPPQGSRVAQVARRNAMGYEVTDLDAEALETAFSKGSTVVVGDVVLMEIDKELREEDEEHLKELALEEARRPKEAFYRAMERNKHRGLGATPTGEVSYDEREYELNLPDKE